MIYKFQNGGIIKLQAAGIIPKLKTLFKAISKKGSEAVKTLTKSANKVPTTIETVPDSHRVFRATVYKGGSIRDPYFSFFTTDPEYAKQYGPVNKYILEQKGPAVIAKEPMIGSRDIVENDMFIDRNTKDVPGAKIILGHDLITSDIPIKSKGLEILSINVPNSLISISDPKAATTYHFDGRMPLTRPISFEEKLGWTKGERNQPVKQSIKSNPRYFLDSEELFPRDLVEIVPDDALVPNIYKQYMLSHKSDKHRGFDIYGWLEEPPADHETVINNINDFAKTLPDYDPRFAREDGNPSFYITQFRDYLSSLGYDTSDISDESVLKLLTHQYKELSSGATGKLKGRLVFHGTDKPFESFDYRFTGKNTGNMGYNGAGNYFTTHPSAYGSKTISGFFGPKYRPGWQQPYMITGIKATPLNNGKLSPKLNIPAYISPHGGDYKPVIDRAIKMADTEAVKDIAVIDDISHYPIQLFTEEIPISEFSVARNTGIKSLFPHPSRFIRNEDGTVSLIPTDWSDIRVNYKRGGIIKGQGGIGQGLRAAMKNNTRPDQTTVDNARKINQAGINASVKDNGERYAIGADRSNDYANDPYVAEYFEKDVIPRYMREHHNATKAELDALRRAYHYPQKSGELNPSYGGVTSYNGGTPTITYNESRGDPSRTTVVHENTHAYRYGIDKVRPSYNYGFNSKEEELLNEAYSMDNYSNTINSVAEMGATNAEIRYVYWRKLYDTLGRVPTLEEMDNYINSLPLGTLERVERGVNNYGKHSVNEQRDDRSNMFIAPGQQRVSEMERRKRDALIHVADNSEQIDMTNLAKQGCKLRFTNKLHK